MDIKELYLYIQMAIILYVGMSIKERGKRKWKIIS